MNHNINQSNRMELSFQNLPENERIGRTMAAIFASVLDPTLEELSDFKTAVSEAVTNAIIHAYPGEKGIVKMVLERHRNEIKVKVADYGVGIEDIKRSMEPLYTTLPAKERSGMGFTFMEAFTDDLKVESEPGKGTSVYLSKTMGHYPEKKEGEK